MFVWELYFQRPVWIFKEFIRLNKSLVKYKRLKNKKMQVHFLHFEKMFSFLFSNLHRVELTQPVKLSIVMQIKTRTETTTGKKEYLVTKTRKKHLLVFSHTQHIG